MTSLAPPTDVTQAKTGDSLRRRAREAAEEAVARNDREMAERSQRVEAAAKSGLAQDLKRHLNLDIYVSSIGGYVDPHDTYRGTFHPRVEIDGFTFGWRRSRDGAHYDRLFLCWKCPTCGDEIQSRGNITSYYDLGEHIDQVDAWASGDEPCPTCVYLAKEAAENRPAPDPAPAPPKPTAAERLRACIFEIVEEELAMADINHDRHRES